MLNFIFAKDKKLQGSYRLVNRPDLVELIHKHYYDAYRQYCNVGIYYSAESKHFTYHMLYGREMTEFSTTLEVTERSLVFKYKNYRVTKLP